MAVTPLTADELASMRSKLTHCMIGNGKAVHLSKGANHPTLCGKTSDIVVSSNTDAPVCKRCYVTAEKNYRMDRRISYECMRDAELDRITEAEEKKAMSEYMEYAERTTDADIAILTADGFVECTPEILAEALTELAEPKPFDMYNEICKAYDRTNKLLGLPGTSAELLAEALTESIMPVRADYADSEAFESAIRNAYDTAREEGFAVGSPEWHDMFALSYSFMEEENATMRRNTEMRAIEDSSDDATFHCPNCEHKILCGFEDEHSAPCYTCDSDGHAECQHAACAADQYGRSGEVVYPYTVGTNLVYACCKSSIGPVCNHLAEPDYDPNDGMDAIMGTNVVSSHTNPYNRPDFIGGGNTEDARWCGVCKCWDMGLIESADSSMYVHPTDVVNPDSIVNAITGVADCTECGDHIMVNDVTVPSQCADGCDAGFMETETLPELVETITDPLIVEALLNVHMDGVTVSLGWKTITVPVGTEKSLATLYAEQSGSTWHRVGAPKWDSIITVMEEYS